MNSTLYRLLHHLSCNSPPQTCFVSSLVAVGWLCADITPGDPGWPGSYPDWWYNAGNPGASVVKVNEAELNRNNNALLVIGQLKHIASQARDELQTQLSSVGGAGTEIDTLVSSFTTVDPRNLSPANIGQLKAVSAPFYKRFAQVGFTPAATAGWPAGMELIDTSGATDNSPLYPWLDDVTPGNAAIASIGQAKNLFSFDLAAWLQTHTVPAAPGQLSAELNADSSLSLSWTDNSDNEMGFQIDYSEDGGTTWTTVTTLAANTTATALAAGSPGTGGTAQFRVSAITAAGTSGSTAAPTNIHPAANADGDLYSTAYELAYGMDPGVNEAESNINYGPGKDFDGDGLLNEEDAVPTDGDLTWQRTPESSYALIDLGEAPYIPSSLYHGNFRVNANGTILFPVFGYGADYSPDPEDDPKIRRLGDTTWQTVPLGSLLQAVGNRIAVTDLGPEGQICGWYFSEDPDNFYVYSGFLYADGAMQQAHLPVTNASLDSACPQHIAADGRVYGICHDADSGLQLPHAAQWTSSGASVQPATVPSDAFPRQYAGYYPLFYAWIHAVDSKGRPLWRNESHLGMSYSTGLGSDHQLPITQGDWLALAEPADDVFLLGGHDPGGAQLWVEDGAALKAKALYTNQTEGTRLAGSITHMTDDGTALLGTVVYAYDNTISSITSNNQLWRNGVVTPLDDLVNNKDAYGPLAAHDMASNGNIVATAKRIKDDQGNDILPTDQKEHVLLLLNVDIEVPKTNPLTGVEFPNQSVSAQELKVGKMEGAVDENGIRIEIE